jgi:hypothetical protein
MKKLSVLLIFALAIAFILPSCKYEEGPSVSFRSKTSRLVNKWKIEKVLINGYDVTVDYKETLTDLVLDIQDNGDAATTYVNSGDSTVTYTEQWEFNSDKTGVVFSINGAFDILMLKNDEIWLKQTLTVGIITSTKEFHYVTN